MRDLAKKPYSRRGRHLYPTKEEVQAGLISLLEKIDPEFWNSNWILKNDRALHASLIIHFGKPKEGKGGSNILWEEVFKFLDTKYVDRFAPEGSDKLLQLRRAGYVKEGRKRAISELEELLRNENPSSFNANWIKDRDVPLHRLIINVFRVNKASVDWEAIQALLPPELAVRYQKDGLSERQKQSYQAKKLVPTVDDAIKNLTKLLRLLEPGEQVNPKFVRSILGDPTYRALLAHKNWDDIIQKLPKNLRDRFVYGLHAQIGKHVDLSKLEKRLKPKVKRLKLSHQKAPVETKTESDLTRPALGETREPYNIKSYLPNLWVQNIEWLNLSLKLNGLDINYPKLATKNAKDWSKAQNDTFNYLAIRMRGGDSIARQIVHHIVALQLDSLEVVSDGRILPIKKVESFTNAGLVQAITDVSIFLWNGNGDLIDRIFNVFHRCHNFIKNNSHKFDELRETKKSSLIVGWDIWG